MALQVTLPWPPSETSSNGSQGDFRGKARAAASYKLTCSWECKLQRLRQIEHDGDLAVEITFCPPRNGKLDADNTYKRMKQGQDAVSEAIGIDDARWWPVTLCKGPKVDGGKVVIRFLPEPPVASLPVRGAVT